MTQDFEAGSGGLMLAGPLRLAAGAALGLVALFFGATAYVGGFTELRIVEGDVGPFRFAYQELYGADLVEVRRLSDELAGRLGEAGIAVGPPMAVFHPDSLEGQLPNETGVVLTEEEAARAAALPDPPALREIPEQRSMVTSFPRHRPLAYVVGYFRAESVLGRHRDASRYRRTPLAVILSEDRIEYVQPIVPNALSAE